MFIYIDIIVKTCKHELHGTTISFILAELKFFLGKLGHSCTNVIKPYGSRVSYHAIVHLGLNVSSSAHNCGCVVDGGNAMAAI